MKVEKQKLTRITNSVKEKFPDGEDIYGYNGITKNKVIHSLNESYNILGLLESISEEVETIWVKRKLATYFDDLFSLLKDIESEAWKDKFDHFLNLIYDLRRTLKDLYITLTSNPIRIEEDIQIAKEEFESLKKQCNSINEIIEKIKDESDKSSTLLEELELLKVNFTKATEEAQKINAEISVLEEKASKSKEAILDISPKITVVFTEVKELQNSLNLHEQKLNTLSANLEKNVEILNNTQKILNDQVEADSKLQKEINQTLQDVNKHGMAGAFLKRKKELRVSTIIWGTLSVISMGVLIYISYRFAVSVFNTGELDLLKNLFKIPSVIAAVWLCWFCAKQFGYTIRIREDYSYKYAISMAFEGYKNETREVNQELLGKLLEVTIANISSNPVVLYNAKSNHGSPWHELTDGIKNFLKIDAKANVTVDTKDIPKL